MVIGWLWRRLVFAPAQLQVPWGPSNRVDGSRWTRAASSGWCWEALLSHLGWAHGGDLAPRSLHLPPDRAQANPRKAHGASLCQGPALSPSPCGTPVLGSAGCRLRLPPRAPPRPRGHSVLPGASLPCWPGLTPAPSARRGLRGHLTGSLSWEVPPCSQSLVDASCPALAVVPWGPHPTGASCRGDALQATCCTCVAFMSSCCTGIQSSSEVRAPEAAAAWVGASRGRPPRAPAHMSEPSACVQDARGRHSPSTVLLTVTPGQVVTAHRALALSLGLTFSRWRPV